MKTRTQRAEEAFQDWLEYARAVRGNVPITEFQEQLAKLMAAKIVDEYMDKLLRRQFYPHRRTRSMKGK